MKRGLTTRQVARWAYAFHELEEAMPFENYLGESPYAHPQDGVTVGETRRDGGRAAHWYDGIQRRWRPAAIPGRSNE